MQNQAATFDGGVGDSNLNSSIMPHTLGMCLWLIIVHPARSSQALKRSIIRSMAIIHVDFAWAVTSILHPRMNIQLASYWPFLQSINNLALKD